MFKSRCILRLALGISLASIFPFTEPSPVQATNQKVLRVGTVDNYLPCSDNVDGRHIGLSVDLWRTIAERLKIHYEISTVPTFNSGVDLASRNKYDVIASCHNITKERLKKVEYSTPYRQDGLAVLSKKTFALSDILIFRILSDRYLIGSLISLCAICYIGSLVVHKANHPQTSGQDAESGNNKNLFKTFTKFLVGEYGVETINKGVPVVILFFFLRLAFITTLVGSSVTEIFRSEKAVDSNKITNSQLIQMFKDGLAVQSGTVQELWLQDRIDKMQVSEALRAKIISINSAESELVDLLERGKVNHLLSETTLLNTFRSQLERPNDFYISVEDPVKEFQAFVFGRNLPRSYVKLINMSITDLVNKGEVNRLTEMWKDKVY